MLKLKQVLLQGALAVGLATGAMAVTSAPAAAWVACDEDGDDCNYVPPYPDYRYNRWDGYDRYNYGGYYGAPVYPGYGGYAQPGFSLGFNFGGGDYGGWRHEGRYHEEDDDD